MYSQQMEAIIDKRVYLLFQGLTPRPLFETTVSLKNSYNDASKCS
jgi:hypothetical protein